MKKNSFDPENQAGSERGTVMNRLFDTSVNVGLRQFYVLGAAGSIGNLFGFVGNVYIYGLSAPTIFCALCTLVIFGMTVWGIRSRHVKRAAYVIITLNTLLHLPDGNDRVYGARHGGNCNLSSNDCSSDLRMSRFSGGYVSGHPCILSSGGCGIGNG